ncbi:protein-glutamate methylesterase/protein-glutamine glutaminase [Niveispirillum fermenti]|uniref:protein-glutamate methylesterase/protein-glutamine glutaminase n=1 Tax=Niveispirillum fermenti TaxID=1233113 RepID=UPI003A8A03CF
MNELPGRPVTQATPTGTEPYRVMVVDDSAVIRGLLTRSLEGDPEIKVVASVANGQMAINTLQRQMIDVIVLDIEMPVLDGLSALPHLLAVDPHVKIVMASTLTAKNADISLRALKAGAADYIPKPSSTRELTSADDFKRELTGKVKALALAARKADPRKGAPTPAAGTPAAPGIVRPVTPVGTAPPTTGFTLSPPVRLKPETGPISLRPVPDFRPDVLAIGSSTGGPQALFEVLSHLKDGIRQPILITQHMPATFTTILAEHITRQCGVQCAEAKEGEPIVGGRAYVAPGDFHMLVVQKNGVNYLTLTKDPPENFCRPSVDPMLRSIVRAYGKRVLVTILTGMGHDGQRGSEAVVQAGGAILGQDEPSSVVWGMPGAVATAGLCSAVLPLKEIGPYIRKIALRQAA